VKKEKKESNLVKIMAFLQQKFKNNKKKKPVKK